jgi:hypothetical protein
LVLVVLADRVKHLVQVKDKIRCSARLLLWVVVVLPMTRLVQLVVQVVVVL